MSFKQTYNELTLAEKRLFDNSVKIYTILENYFLDNKNEYFVFLKKNSEKVFDFNFQEFCEAVEYLAQNHEIYINYLVKYKIQLCFTDVSVVFVNKPHIIR